ncbi:hypothetical protein, partial [Mycolicibacterium smegmatis]
QAQPEHTGKAGQTSNYRMPATPNAAETTHGHLKEGRSTDSGLATWQLGLISGRERNHLNHDDDDGCCARDWSGGTFTAI